MCNFVKFIPKFVDLGLPSGLKWAKCNVGAYSETESGKYFQWGDVEGRYADELDKNPCNWETTPWGLFKQPIETLDSEHDATTAAYGENYRMPTKEEFNELYNYTINEWVENYKGSGVNGALFTSRKNGNSIFFPASGYFNYGNFGFYWSSNLNSDFPSSAYYFGFYRDAVYSKFDLRRCNCFSVRAVSEF